MNPFEPYHDPISKDDSTIFPLDGINLQDVSDEILISLFDTAPVLYRCGATKVVRLSQHLVLKGGGCTLTCEAANMMFVAASTQILLPAVHRIINVKEDDEDDEDITCFIIMDYIHGTSVEDCWPELDEEQRLLVSSQIAQVLQSLQSVTVHQQQPGPIGGGDARCSGIWFTVFGAGPFYTLNEMEDWFNRKLDVCLHFKQALPNTPRFNFNSLVLTHMDIAPRNLILDRSGRLWVIDWGTAGAYPPGFEWAALKMQHHHKDFSEEVCSKTKAYPVQLKQLRSIFWALTTAIPT